MFACRWLQVFALAACVARRAYAEEDLSQTGRKTTNASPKLVKITTELRMTPEGNLTTRCFVSRIPVQTPSEGPTEGPQDSSSPSVTCSPPETPTAVYDSRSLFKDLTDAAVDFSLIQEEAKNYFVSSGEKSLSKADVLGIIFDAMSAGSENERLVSGINALRSQLKLSGLEEKPVTVVVCLPDDPIEERKIINNCAASKAAFAVASSDVTPSVPYVKAAVKSSTTPLSDLPNDSKGNVFGGGRRKTLIDLLKGDKGRQIFESDLPKAVTGPLPAFVTNSRPSAVSTPTTASIVVSENSQRDLVKIPGSSPLPIPRPPQTSASLRFSVSGIITAAAWPSSISKLTAQLSLSFAPAPEGPPDATPDPTSSSLAPTSMSANDLSSKTPTVTVPTVHNSETVPQTTPITGDPSPAIAAASATLTSESFSSSAPQTHPEEPKSTSTTPPPLLSLPLSSSFSPSPAPTATSTTSEFSHQNVTSELE